ncbi:HD-GYP domain-containing protein [Oscillibacter sp. GMB15532]|uniref:HD-GYP domain-containing protein n=1 Tax=Oscillibacter sp. GMB15532 TaxID=3230022 RepID=UPI0034DF02FB
MSGYFNKVPDEYFIEQDATCILKKDIYNNNGRLLLARGTKITKETKLRLQSMGTFQPTYANSFNDPLDFTSSPTIKEPEDMLTPVVQTFALRKNISNVQIIEQPYRILTPIMFESKGEPWWALVEAMISDSKPLYAHSIDVAIISLILAVELKFDEDAQKNLGLGAFLHDVGKLLLPKTDTEPQNSIASIDAFRDRQHCELGANTLKVFGLPELCTDIVMDHHEYLDGSGYPRGLKGNEIPREAQVVMVANILDNLTSSQSYEPPLSIDSAINRLKNEINKYPQEIVLILERVLKSSL